MKTWIILVSCLLTASTLSAQSIRPVPMPVFPMPMPLPLPVLPMPVDTDCRGTGEMLSEKECGKAFAYAAGTAALGSELGDSWYRLSDSYQRDGGFKFDSAVNVLSFVDNTFVADSGNEDEEPEEETALVDGLGEISSLNPAEFTLTETYKKTTMLGTDTVEQTKILKIEGRVEVICQGSYRLTVLSVTEKAGKTKLIPAQKVPLSGNGE